MQPSSLMRKLFHVTAHIAATDGADSWQGTGFVYGQPLVAGGQADLLVTNKHVLQGATKVTIRMIRATENDTPQLGVASQITVDNFGERQFWTGHPDPRVDVAVLPLGEIEQGMADRGMPPFIGRIGPEVAYRPGDGTVDAIEDITFIGYPIGLYDKHNLLPIARTGTTATPPEVDYEGLPAFLIDASVFPGSSGSPVVIANHGAFGGPDGPRLGEWFRFLGVLAAVHTRQVSGTVVELPARLIAKFDEPIDLGVVYRADAIEQTIDLVLAAHGHQRAVT